MTIFTYGQTASGKTFTMRGASDQSQPGIIPLAMKDIFHELYSHHGLPFKPHHLSHHHLYMKEGGKRDSFSPKINKVKTWIVKVSYIEIYNECVNDLLDPMRKNLSVRENQQGKPVIDNLSEYEVTSLEETLHYLLKGDE